MKTEVTENIFEQAWDGFKGTNWRDKASVTRFVQENYKPYDGDESFLAGPTERTLKVKKIIEDTKAHYEEVGFPFDTDRVTSIDKSLLDISMLMIKNLNSSMECKIANFSA